MIATASATISRPADRAAYVAALQQDPLASARDVVRVIRASGQRREAFEAYREEGNRDGWWGIIEKNGKKEQRTVPPQQLLRDVRTRWDSVYYMLRRLRLNRPVRALIDLSSSSNHDLGD
jgi:hypothetical protein